jgi:BTB And C-terminal Kelch
VKFHHKYISTQVICNNPAAALASDPWLGISLESVLEFLKLDCLSVEEAELVRALVRWGKFQVERDAGDPQQAEKLRATILPGLKHIKFAKLNQKEFAKLSVEELRDVLTAEEKLHIVQSLLLGDVKLLPCSLAL